MKSIHLLMPMGGKGSRFSDSGIEVPKPLIKINDKPFFYWSTMSVAKFIDLIDITFVVLKEHMISFGIDDEIHSYFPEAKIQVINEVLNGAVLTCLEGLKLINDNNPVLFNDCDHMFRSKSFEQFCKSNDHTDGALLTFESDESKYSYLKMDDDGNIIGTVEKQVVSSNAICGCYYFANKELFINASEKYLRSCSYKEFFVSGVYNIMASEGKKIGNFPTEFHVPFGTPEEYDLAKGSTLFGELL